MPTRAVAYVNALGYYELYLEGRKVDDHVLSPAVSDYSKRNLYVAHEVAEYLVPGKNVIALWLGRGWYVRGHPGVIHDGPLVRAQLDISMGDGRTSRVVTDGTWKLRESPLTPLGRGTAFGDYGGERYDSRRDLPDWNAVGLDDSDWQAAALFEPPEVLTAAQMVEPNRVVETIQAVRVEPYSEGTWLVDMGKASTGWLEIRLPAIAKGATVKLEYSDQAEPDKPAPSTPAAWGPPVPRFWGPPPAAVATGQGGVRSSAGAAPSPAGRGGNPTVLPNTANQRDEVVGNGAPLVFRSRFNYHGFRYVRVIGTDAAPAVSDATGHLIRAAYERAGDFTSSNDLLNQIYQMTTRTYEALTLGGYSPGFKHFVIKPSVVGDLTFAKASYRSIHGEIVSDWRIENGAFRLRVTVPPGTKATVVVPGEGPIRTPTGRPASTSAGPSRSFEVGPGVHSFETPHQPKQ